jgi:hypothetical protein
MRVLAFLLCMLLVGCEGEWKDGPDNPPDRKARTMDESR